MKKVLLFVAVVTATSFASCKKDYTCKCTTTYSGSFAGTPSSTVDSGKFKTTKKKAKTICDVYESSDSNSTTTCEAVK